MASLPCLLQVIDFALHVLYVQYKIVISHSKSNTVLYHYSDVFDAVSRPAREAARCLLFVVGTRFAENHWTAALDR